jgi:hypothetical protein
VGGDPGVRLRVQDVGVIAPYRAQVLRLRQLLRGRGLGAVRVGTVDDYQGQEERVMFISTVVSRPPRGRATGTSPESPAVAAVHLGFLACPRRFNVAISRAKAGRMGLYTLETARVRSRVCGFTARICEAAIMYRLAVFQVYLLCTIMTRYANPNSTLRSTPVHS